MVNMTVTVLRGGTGTEETIEVATVAAGSDGPDRLVAWAGALIQPTPRALASQRGIDAQGLYVAWFWGGAPASRYGLGSTLRLLAIDEQPVATLDELLAAVAGKPDRSSVRIRVANLDGREQVLTLKLDLEYWPTYELILSNGRWERQPR